MSASSASTPTDYILLACLACGDPFTPDGLAEGNLPVIFSCGHTVCVDCARNVALSLPGYDGKWACGWCKRGDGGAVNAGMIALVQSLGSEAVDSGPVLSLFYQDPDTIEEPSAPFDFSALTSEATAAITTALTDLERVNTARATMRAGFESSRTMFIAGIDSLLSSIIAHRDRVLGEAKLLFDAREKALGVQVEELSVKVSLLRQAVDVYKAVVDGGVEASPAVYGSVRMSVKGLMASPFAGLSVPPAVGIDFDAGTVLEGIESSIRIARTLNCELSGPGVDRCISGGPSAAGALEQNALRLVCKDLNGGIADGVDLCDVSLRVLSVGDADGVQAAGDVVSIVREAPGVFRCVYAVGTEDVYIAVVQLDVCVYGEPAARSRVRVPSIPQRYFGSSTVLTSVAPATREAFQRAISKKWLPGAGPPALLFRMSRDGTATSDFHSRCDGKASTVTLIKSNNGYVFGGYAGPAWNSSNTFIACSKSFVFTVSNPHGIPPTSYLVNNGLAALVGHAAHGPYFGSALCVGDGQGTLTSQSRTPLKYYTDTTHKGGSTFTGATDHPYFYFTAAEIEVWQVPMDE